MKSYVVWNNKGGTGKTSLSFQAICRYAEQNSGAKILVIDACPQANLSELLLGGLEGKGSSNLFSLHQANKRKSIAGYFQERLPSPFSSPLIKQSDFLCKPSIYNPNIAGNIDLLAGDPVVELQANAIATLANTQIPGTDTWIKVVDWLNDFIAPLGSSYDVLFIDANPSFSIYTQIALSSADFLILPVMADDSSRRAIQNAFSLIYGINLPSATYSQYSFTTKLGNAKRPLLKVKAVVKNRLTQYMGPASAYNSVLSSIDDILNNILKSNASVFDFSNLSDGLVNVRDFQTTGVVAFAKGAPFSKVSAGYHSIQGKKIQVAQKNIDNCLKAVDDFVGKL